MSSPDFVVFQLYCLHKPARIIAPAWDVLVIELSKTGRCPSRRMHPVCYPVDIFVREHGPAHFGVSARDSVDIAAELQSEVCHGKSASSDCAFKDSGKIWLYDTVYQRVREKVVPCRDRCMGCKDNLISDLFYVAVALFAKQLKSDKAGMSFVQVKSFYICKAHVAKQSESAYSKDKLLAEAIFVVSAVKFVC